MLNDKVILITGAAGLIGRSLIKLCLDKGAKVVATDFNKNILDALKNCSDFESFEGSLYFHELDITNKNSIEKAIGYASSIKGSIDAIINSAYPRNASYGKKLEDVDYESFTENLSLHVGGYFLVSQQFCEEFKKQGKGVILNMASIYGVMAPRFDIYENTKMTMPVEYAAIKSSIINLTKYFAQYYKEAGIRVNALSPGGVLDGQDKAFLNRYNRHCSSKGMLDPEDVAKAAVFLVSDDASYINGQNFIVDDGFSL